MSISQHEYWLSTLRQLADTPDDFDNQAGDVVFTRQGREHHLTLRDRPGAGLCVMRSIEDLIDYVPIEIYIQRDLLDLPRLAQQIQRSLDRMAQRRVARFVDGPAQFEINGALKAYAHSSENLKVLLCESEPGVTMLLQLMAPAGHGKTVLLEEVSYSFARTYKPETNPFPIVLLVDLLGRFVGNIDDAIAGAINNTYSFPSLTQKDVIVAMRNRWLTLALDGFDELVARIGPKDAFLRISDLLDQVNGAGSIVISARESFFELHRITIAIRSYLLPKRGSFKTSIVRLLPWTDEQGRDVFQNLGSKDPTADLSALQAAFADNLIVFQPFFLTRLAELWQKGERFDSSKIGSHLERISYVVGKLLDREVAEKWRDSKGIPILTLNEHEFVLCTVAEEMFRTGAFFLRAEEIRLTSQFALEELRKPSAVIQDAIERFPTHAFFQSTERGYRFSHDKFYHYFLGLRLANLCQNKADEFLSCISSKELGPEIVEWLIASLPQSQDSRLRTAQAMLARVDEKSSTELRSNLGYVVPALLNGLPCNGNMTIDNLLFTGDGLRGLTLIGLQFSRCIFSAIDASDTKFRSCLFFSSKIDNFAISDGTRLTDCIFKDCTIITLTLLDKDRSFFSPKEISERLSLAGARFESPVLPSEKLLADEVNGDHIQVVEKLVRASHKGWDICVEEFVEKWGNTGQRVIDAALANGVLRKWNREVAGPRKHFVRFQVDRNLLLASLRDPSPDKGLRKFWQSI